MRRRVLAIGLAVAWSVTGCPASPESDSDAATSDGSTGFGPPQTTSSTSAPPSSSSSSGGPATSGSDSTGGTTSSDATTSPGTTTSADDSTSDSSGGELDACEQGPVADASFSIDLSDWPEVKGLYYEIDATCVVASVTPLLTSFATVLDCDDDGTSRLLEIETARPGLLLPAWAPGETVTVSYDSTDWWRVGFDLMERISIART